LEPIESRRFAGDAKADQYAAAVEALIDDPNNDGILVLLSPQATSEPMATAERLKHLVSRRQKPILACWMGGNAAAEAEAVLNAIGMPTFTHPDAAARAFCLMAKYGCNLRGLYETPVLLTESPEQTQRERVEGILAKVRKAGRALLTELEAKEILSCYAIPALETQMALNEAQTVSRRAVSANAVELFLGKRIDADFGPMIIFGAGGQLGEFWHDRAIAFPPLNATSAKRLMERARIYAALNGSAGRPRANLDALEKVLIRFGPASR
jgi:acetyltransferase